LGWLGDGHEVELLCEALPWPAEPARDDEPAAHRRRRSFAAHSGRLPLRVIVVLAAAFSGRCPNLGADDRCAVYARRPLVCRIYPAEIHPFLTLVPAHKGCPPQAWDPGQPALLRAGRIVEAETHAAIEASREADRREAGLKQRLCAELGVDCAAIGGEGFVAHRPPRPALRTALQAALQSAAPTAARTATQAALQPAGEADTAAAGASDWRLVSRSRRTLDELGAAGARIGPADALANGAYLDLGAVDAEPGGDPERSGGAAADLRAAAAAPAPPR
ncbi:MAG: YkgJ family cysteine cluster protein, partial [Burkholderiales bacterium]|nr:YkgJ family cysteine cluster protein [Burkholderiales bacterium]